MNKDKYDIDWAWIVDILASEYGWTIDYISTLNIGQVSALLKAMYKRKKRESGDSPNNEPPSEKELSMADFKAMGGQEHIREDGRKEIIL